MKVDEYQTVVELLIEDWTEKRKEYHSHPMFYSSLSSPFLLIYWKHYKGGYGYWSTNCKESRDFKARKDDM